MHSVRVSFQASAKARPSSDASPPRASMSATVSHIAVNHAMPSLRFLLAGFATVIVTGAAEDEEEEAELADICIPGGMLGMPGIPGGMPDIPGGGPPLGKSILGGAAGQP